MSAYTPNPPPSSENGYASLSAGLLARKGEAMPSVDADAHAGIDIEMRPMVPSPGPVNATGYSKSENAPSADGSEAPISTKPSALLPPIDQQTGEDRLADQTCISAPPDNWTLAAKQRTRLRRRSPLRAVDDDAHQRKATVTFRMAAKQFVRMRFAARDLEMSCQMLILEAVECYLEANDVELVTDDICDAEVHRLMRKKKKAPARQKAASLVD